MKTFVIFPSSYVIDSSGRYFIFKVLEYKDKMKIKPIIDEAIEASRILNSMIQFELYDVTIKVVPDSNPKSIFLDWLYARKSCLLRDVGPLNSAFKESEKVHIRGEYNSRKENAERENNILECKLANTPSIELLDKVKWSAFSKKYSRQVVVCFERWARLMQVEMSSDKNIEHIVSSTWLKADFKNITDLRFMFRSAVSEFFDCWKHGKELQKWYKN